MGWYLGEGWYYSRIFMIFVVGVWIESRFIGKIKKYVDLNGLRKE